MTYEEALQETVKRIDLKKLTHEPGVLEYYELVKEALETQDFARYAETHVLIHTAGLADKDLIGATSHDSLPQNPAGNARQRAY